MNDFTKQLDPCYCHGYVDGKRYGLWFGTLYATVVGTAITTCYVLGVAQPRYDKLQRYQTIIPDRVKIAEELAEELIKQSKDEANSLDGRMERSYAAGILRSVSDMMRDAVKEAEQDAD